MSRLKFGRYYIDGGADSPARIYDGEGYSKMLDPDFKVLRELIDKRGQPVLKEDLLRFYRQDANIRPGANDVEKSISRIRNLLFDSDRWDPRYIATVPDGYMFVAEVESVEKIPAGDRTGDEGPDSSAAAEIHDEDEAGAPGDGLGTFNDWRKDAGKGIFFVLVSLIAAGLVASSVWAALHSFLLVDEIAQNIQILGCAVNLVLIVAASIYLFRSQGIEVFPPLANDLENGRLKTYITNSTGYTDPASWEGARNIATRKMRDYRIAWMGLLASWFFLYGFLILRLIFSRDPENNFMVSLFILSSNLNTLFLGLCFLTLNEPITTKDKDQPNNMTTLTTESKNEKLWLILFFVASLVCFAVDVISRVHAVTQLVSGILAGVAMAHLIGRFQSKFLRSPRSLILLFYGYTVIQSLVVFLANQTSEAWAAFVINIVLIPKCFLLLYMFWLFESGRLLFYLVRVRRAFTQVNNEWQDFRRIFHHEN